MTDSKFNLIKYENQLVNANSSEGSSRYRKIAPQRDVSGDNFPNGSISFKWSNNATTYLDLEGSKLEEQIVITDSDGTTPLTVADGIALSNANNQFSKTQLFLNGHEIDSSEYCGEVEGWVSRTDKSGSWLNGYGQSTDNWGDYNVRVNEISSDGISNITAVSSTVSGSSAEYAQYKHGGLNPTATWAPLDAQAFVSSTMPNGNPFGIEITTIGAEGIQVKKAGRYLMTFFASGGGYAGIQYYVKFSKNGSIAPAPVVAPTEIGITATIYESQTDITTVQNISMAGVFDFALDDVVQVWHKVSTAGAPAMYNLQLNLVEVGGSTGTITTTTNNSRRITGEVLSFKPMLGLWRTMNKYLVSGDYELRLTPHPDYYTKIVETATAKTHGTDYKIVVNSLHLKVREVQGQRMDDGVFLLDYCGYGCQPQNLTSTTSSQEKTFEVSPSTFMLGVAYSSSTSGTSTIYPPSKFRSASDVERSLNQLLVRYSNQAYPDTGVIESSYTAGGTDYRGMLYADTYNCCENDDPEDFDEWGNKRGMFVNCGFLKDASDVSTTVNVISKFSTASANTRMLLFSKYRKVAKVQVQNGRVVDVQTSNN